MADHFAVNARLPIMKRPSTVAVLAIALVCSPSVLVCSFPPDIHVTFEGWSADVNKFALRKIVIDTGSDSVDEDVLYSVDVASSRIAVEKKEKYNPDALEKLHLTKAGPVESSDRGVKTFIVGDRYVYVDFHTVMEEVEEGAWRYTIHRRLWTFGDGLERMILKEDEAFANVATRSEVAQEAYVSPDSGKLLILFDVSSSETTKGFVVLDLVHSRMLERGIHVLD